jgi:oligopeptide/dipeptide ABC transporter ATP-binding protein
MNFNNKEMRALRKEFQIIFQDPFASLDPRKKIFDIIAQGLKIHTSMNREEVNKKVISTIKEVGLQEEHLGRYPHEFSGGQRQRIGIARALVLNPKFIIADEPVSALDVTIQAQILNLILELKEKYSLTILFISHDLSVINQIADKVMVMYLGHIVEMASTKNLFSNPRHPYTKSLIETAPQIFRKNKNKVLLKGDIPSPINPPSGCVFRTRCPNPTHDCKEGNIKMGLIEVSPDHWVDQCCVNCS